MSANGVEVAAIDGLCPRAFAWADRKGTAWFGVVMAALLPSLLYAAVYQAMAVVLGGIVIYAVMKARREGAGS